MSSKKVPDLKRWLFPKLRRISLSWPGKAIARQNAKVRVEIGTFKNGNIKYKILYRCASCTNLFPEEETQMDHIKPVISPSEGFTSWDISLPTLFSQPNNYQCLCLECHTLKSLNENKIRYKTKKKRLTQNKK